MADTADRVSKALSEVRTLVLGTQILIGFQYQAIFRDAFDQLPSAARLAEPLALCLLLAAIACLIAPAAFHRLGEHGNATVAQDRFTRWMIGASLAPFAVAIGLDVFIATSRHYGLLEAALFGSGVALLALLMWFGVEIMVRPERTLEHKRRRADEPTPLKEKLTELLTEARIILPGVQALLGLQFAAYLTSGFDQLPRLSQHIHTAVLFALVLSMLLLMRPAPYHRLAERGEDTPRAEKVSAALILASLVPLALALAGDLHVVLERTLHSTAGAAAGAAILLVADLGLWFGLPLAVRLRGPQAARPRPS